MRDMVKQLVAGIGRSKPTPICPYMLHLFYVHDMTLPKDKKAYMVGESMMRHNVESNKEEQPTSTEDADCESFSSRDIVELQA